MIEKPGGKGKKKAETRTLSKPSTFETDIIEEWAEGA